MTNAVGRPISPLVLSADERAYLAGASLRAALGPEIISDLNQKTGLSEDDC